jgi:hypothetical protein
MKNWYKILGVFGFNLIVIWFILKGFVPDLRQRLATIEIFGLVFIPMIIFYLRAVPKTAKFSNAFLMAEKFEIFPDRQD